jgi:hypothetical protein
MFSLPFSVERFGTVGVTGVDGGTPGAVGPAFVRQNLE